MIDKTTSVELIREAIMGRDGMLAALAIREWLRREKRDAIPEFFGLLPNSELNELDPIDPDSRVFMAGTVFSIKELCGQTAIPYLIKTLDLDLTENLLPIAISAAVLKKFEASNAKAALKKHEAKMTEMWEEYYEDLVENNIMNL